MGRCISVNSPQQELFAAGRGSTYQFDLTFSAAKYLGKDSRNGLVCLAPLSDLSDGYQQRSLANASYSIHTTPGTSSHVQQRAIGVFNQVNHDYSAAPESESKRINISTETELMTMWATMHGRMRWVRWYT